MATYKLNYSGEKIDEILAKADNMTEVGSATGETAGKVKLSDATDSESGVADGTAATPKAVKAAYDAASAAGKTADDLSTKVEQNTTDIAKNATDVGQLKEDKVDKIYDKKNLFDVNTFTSVPGSPTIFKLTTGRHAGHLCVTNAPSGNVMLFNETIHVQKNKTYTCFVNSFNVAYQRMYFALYADENTLVSKQFNDKENVVVFTPAKDMDLHLGLWTKSNATYTNYFFLPYIFEGKRSETANPFIFPTWEDLKSVYRKAAQTSEFAAQYLRGIRADAQIRGKSEKVLFFDDFAGDELDENVWNIRENPKGWANNELQAYVREAISVKDGSLHITAKRTEAASSENWTSGRIDTENKIEVGTNCRIECRCKMPKVKGSWPAFWLFGCKPTEKYSTEHVWPGNGEIDIFEQTDANDRIQANVWDYTGGENEQHSKSTNVSDVSDWHNYAVENDGTNIKFSVDNIVFHTVLVEDTVKNGFTPYKDSTSALRIVLNLAVGGDMPTAPDDTTPDEFELVVDYVKVTSLKDPVYIQRLEMPEIVYLSVGEKAGIVPSINKNCPLRTVSYTIADASIATIDDYGRVTAIKSGNTKLIAISETGLKSETEIVVR